MDIGRGECYASDHTGPAQADMSSKAIEGLAGKGVFTKGRLAFEASSSSLASSTRHHRDAHDACDDELPMGHGHQQRRYGSTNASIRFRTNANIYPLANVRNAGPCRDQFNVNEGDGKRNQRSDDSEHRASG